MTAREFKVAQALTSRPVKGMLTGPVTILNWSFVRTDVSRKEQVGPGIVSQGEIEEVLLKLGITLR